MRLATGTQMREVDRRAMAEYGISGLVLMENAGVQVARAAHKWLKKHQKNRVLVLAGSGNNGGDGLVAARHLCNRGYEVRVLFLAPVKKLSQDAAVQFFSLQKMNIEYTVCTEETDWLPAEVWLQEADILLDGVYGTGFHGGLPTLIARVAAWTNQHEIYTIAIDIPSGVHADDGKVQGIAFRADLTLTLALPKPGLYLYPGSEYAGKVKRADIGIPTALLQNGNWQSLTRKEAAYSLPPRKPDSHKGTYGHTVVIGGSGGMLGAVRMAAGAALHAGSGCVTAVVPASLQMALQTAEKEIMTHAVPENKQQQFDVSAVEAILNWVHQDARKNAYVLGPGMGRYAAATELVRGLVKGIAYPMVIDADGLIALSGQTEILREVGHTCVLTPHPGEMSSLTGLSIAEIEANRLEVVQHYADLWQAVVVLKGHRTLIASPDGRLWVNRSGNSGMATAGSGDVLAGLIAGLMAQGMEPALAAAVGVYIHGAAGDLAARKVGEYGLVAGDLLRGIPQMMAQMTSK